MPIGQIFGAQSQAQGQTQAAQLETQEYDKALGLQQSEYNQSRTDQLPWLTTGSSALGQLAKLYGLDTVGPGGGVQKGSGQPSFDINNILQATPDYQFRLTQGLRGVDAGAAQSGGLDSGATRKAEMQYGANLGSQAFDAYAGRLQSLAGLGQGSAQSLGSLGQQNVNAQSGLYGDIGTSQGSAAINKGNIWGNLYSGLGRQAFGGGFGSSSYGGGSSLTSLLGF